MTESGQSAASSKHDAVRIPNIHQQQASEHPSLIQAGQEAEAFVNITVEIVTRLKEIETFRSIWQQMQDTEPSPKPNADFDRFTSVIEANKGEFKPYVMLFRQDDRPVIMVIARSEDRQFNLKLGYRTLLRPRLKCLNVVYGGILGQPKDNLCLIIINELRRQLKSRRFDVVYLNHLNTDSAFYQAVRKAPGFFTRDYFPIIDKHWRMSIPDDMDQFYKACTHGHRGSLRRGLRKFEKEYPGPNNFVKYTRKDEVGNFVKMAAEISSKTYQHAIGAGLVNDEHTISRIKTAASHGWLDGNLLFAGDKPCAFQLGLRYKEVYYLVRLGFDPDLHTLRVGTNLFLKVMESLCKDRSVKMFDFYFGDAEYKKRYGTTHWSEACICIFAPRLYPICINVLRNTIAATNATLVYVMNKFSATGWIKRKWRNLLSHTTKRTHS